MFFFSTTFLQEEERKKNPVSGVKPHRSPVLLDNLTSGDRRSSLPTSLYIYCVRSPPERFSERK